MIVEHVMMSIHPGQEEAFASAFASAPAIFARAEGCHGVLGLRRCHEQPSTYLLLIGWDSVAAHTDVFRSSPLFAEWRGLVGGFFASPPEVLHFGEQLATG